SSYSPASAASRTFANEERAASSSLATRLISFWSSVRSKSIGCLLAGLGQTEHPLGDDVLEHLGGATLDRVAAGAQQLVRPPIPCAQGLGPKQAGGELSELLVGL